MLLKLYIYIDSVNLCSIAWQYEFVVLVCIMVKECGLAVDFIYHGKSNMAVWFNYMVWYKVGGIAPCWISEHADLPCLNDGYFEMFIAAEIGILVWPTSIQLFTQTQIRLSLGDSGWWVNIEF